MKNVPHPNVLRLLGTVVFDHLFGRPLETPYLGMITEYCSQGDLNQYLHAGHFVSIWEKWPLMIDLSLGMAWLHGCPTGYVSHYLRLVIYFFRERRLYTWI
jgi:hypothetical protein